MSRDAPAGLSYFVLSVRPASCWRADGGRPGGLADDGPRPAAVLWLPVASGDDAVHHDQADPGRGDPRRGVAGALGQTAWPDDAQVSGKARRDAPAVAQAVGVGGVRRQVAGELLAAAAGIGGQVVRGEPGERPVAARVRMLALVDAVRPGALPALVRE